MPSSASDRIGLSVYYWNLNLGNVVGITKWTLFGRWTLVLDTKLVHQVRCFRPAVSTCLWKVIPNVSHFNKTSRASASFQNQIYKHILRFLNCLDLCLKFLSDGFIVSGILRGEHNNLFSESMLPFNRLKGNVNSGCPDIRAPPDSSIFNEVDR